MLSKNPYMKTFSNIEQDVEKKFSRREKKKIGKMKVSGKSVIELKKIITKKTKN